jgi:pilus assembly protein CpaC
VFSLRDLGIGFAIAACGSLLTFRAAGASPDAPVAGQAASPAANAAATDSAAVEEQAQAAGPAGAIGKLVVTVGKSLIIDSPLEIHRISVADGNLAEAVAITPKEVLLNGKAAGDTSLIVWQQNGARLIYDLTVRMSTARLDAVRQQIARDFPNEDISVTFENDTAFVRGTVKDVNSAERVMAIASTLGKTVNLLRIQVPQVEPQIVLKVRFANVDRAATTDLGINFASTAFNQVSSIGTGAPVSVKDGVLSGMSSAANILLFRKDIDLGAAIQALESKRLLEMLAEPNLLAISGQEASFLAGGEFPFPIVQPGGNGNAISLMWREYGVRLTFLPTVTARGTIRLKVAPEVSSLDYTNSVSVEGLVVPGLSSRRVQTEVELESGQSFVIAGLLDNQATENFSKIPGIGSIPVLGKLFQSKSVSRSNSELLVIITPEIVRPIPANQPVPSLQYPMPFLQKNSPISLAQPGVNQTGLVPVHPTVDTLPAEELMQKPVPQAPAAPIYQMVPVMPGPPAQLNGGQAAGSGAGTSGK